MPPKPNLKKCLLLCCWLLATMGLFVLLLLAPSPAHGQCPGGTCPTQPSPQYAPPAAQWRPSSPLVPNRQEPTPGQPTPAWRYARPEGHLGAVCRVVVEDGGGQRSIGSGSLVEYEGQYAILTNYHVVKDGRGRIRVAFADGTWRTATLVGTDPTWDLAALELSEPPKGITPAKLQYGTEAKWEPGQRLESAGYGPDGKLAVNSGRFLAYRTRAGATAADWLEMSGRARQGDSGGPIFDARGRLAGVLWGTDGRSVVGTQVGRVHRFLRRVLRGKTRPRRPDLTQNQYQKTPPLVPVPQAGLLPICRPRNPDPTPPPTPPAPEIIIQQDPALAAGINRINASLDQINQNTQPSPPEDPAPIDADPKPLGILICIAGALVAGVMLFYVAGKN